MNKSRLAALVFALASAGAHAEFRTGNKLLEEINSDNLFSRGLALGYIMGTADVGYGTNHCPPQNVTAGQLQDMVKNTLNDVPAIRHMSADSIIFYVLNKTWPCTQKKSGSGV